MRKTTDFSAYKQAVNLELCLSLVKEAYSDIEKGHFDLVEEQLRDILETFDKINSTTNELMPVDNELILVEKVENDVNILHFPSKKSEA
jgi:hypothetical protein